MMRSGGAARAGLQIDGTFDVVGARAALAFFSALSAERLSHGYLFTGPAGVGKKTFGRRLAQSLLCETPKSTLLGYCERCVACRLFTARTHPDFVESDGTIRIGKETSGSAHGDDISSRDIVRDLALHGYRSQRRIVLLGDVAFATHEAANALLRFFEEPPAGVVIVLTTSVPGTLLETIRSRLIELTFPALPTADVERVLVSDGIAAEQARAAAAASFGSITRARSVLDDENGFREAAFAWFECAARGGRPDSTFLQLDDRSLSGAQKRAAVLELIELVRLAVRDWAALTSGAHAAPLLAEDQAERLSSLPQRSLLATVALLSGAGEAERLARTNVSAGLVLDYVRMLLAPPPRRPDAAGATSARE